MRWGWFVVVLLSGCVALNPAYGEDDVGTSGQPKMDTSEVTSGPGSGPSGSTEGGTGGTRGGTIEPGTVGMGVTSSDSSSTGSAIFDLGAWSCEDHSAVVCDAFGDDCQPGTTCRPFDPEGNGSVVDTRCLPDGTQVENEVCWPACTREPEAACGPGLGCVESEAPRGADICRPLCTGTLDDPSCDVGLCFRQTTAEMTGYGVCLGECDPLVFGSCPLKEACVIGLEDPVPRCVPDPLEIPVNGCENAPCPGGFACIPSEAAFDCSVGSCCMEVCDPAAPDCQAEYSCTSFLEAEGPDVPIGFCNPA